MPPLNSPKRSPTSADSQLGTWQNGTFKFNSPDAEQRWAVEAYRNGVHATDWHRGSPVDDKTRDLVLNDLGGPTAPIFRGPDGQYRFANMQTIEPQEVRDHRRRAFQGVKAAELTGPQMPGEDVIAARHEKAAQPARLPATNDNAQPPQQKAPVIADVERPATQATPATADQTKPGIGRFAHMAAAQKEAGYLSPQEVLQHIDDGVRLLANGATLGYADNIAAAGNALFSAGDFGATYDRNLIEEKARTEAATERSGVVGALIESAPQFVPGAGDLLGLAGDAKMYIDDPRTRTLTNAGKTLMGLLPFVPSLASTLKNVDNAVEGMAKVEAKAAGQAEDMADASRTDAGAMPEQTQPGSVSSDLALPDFRPADFDPADPASLEAYFKRPIKGNEGADGHVISKHVGKTQEELRARFQEEPRVRYSSTFTDMETAERVIHTSITENSKVILDWLKAPRGDQLTLSYSGNAAIGISVDKAGNVMQRNSAKILLRKDGRGGFYYFTAYPDN